MPRGHLTHPATTLRVTAKGPLDEGPANRPQDHLTRVLAGRAEGSSRWARAGSRDRPKRPPTTLATTLQHPLSGVPRQAATDRDTSPATNPRARVQRRSQQPPRRPLAGPPNDSPRWSRRTVSRGAGGLSAALRQPCPSTVEATSVVPPGGPWEHPGRMPAATPRRTRERRFSARRTASSACCNESQRGRRRPLRGVACPRGSA